MKDRVSGKVLPNGAVRYGIYGEDGTLTRYEYIKPEDEPAEAGTPLNKATLLPDDVCDVLGIDRQTATPADAFLAIPGIIGKAMLRVTVKHANGTPYAGLQIAGITGVEASRCITNGNGILSIYVSEGTYTVSSALADVIIDTTITSATFTIRAGEVKDVTLQESYRDVTRLEITSTRKFAFSQMVAGADAFAVGGGGGGDESHAGGGGGYTKTVIGIQFTPHTIYDAIVGSGGRAGTKGGTGGGTGGDTSCLGIVANGGIGGRTISGKVYGGDGGSGGSCGIVSSTVYDGGKDGASSGDVNSNYIGGVGQGTTTREFGEAGGKLYAGGGGGLGNYYSNPSGGWSDWRSKGGDGGGADGAYYYGNSDNPSQPAGAATPNTGGGGGGGSYSAIKGSEEPSPGASGIIVIRWRYK